MNFHDNSEKKNRKTDFSFDSAHCTCFMKVGSKLGGGLHIVSWDTASSANRSVEYTQFSKQNYIQNKTYIYKQIYIQYLYICKYEKKYTQNKTHM